MHICYLDESGSHYRSANTPYFVLLGFAIPAATWRAKDAEIEAVLDTHTLFGEVHTAWMMRKYPEQERIVGFSGMANEARQLAVEKERKIDLGKAALRGPTAVKVLARNYKKTARYTHLTFGERDALVRALADKIGSWNDAVIFADAQLKSCHPLAASDEKILDHAFEQVSSRFHTFLTRTNADLGILVQDQNDTAAVRLTQLARRFHARGSAFTAMPKLVETPLFVDSKLTSMVQLADLCSFAVRRFFEKGETDLFDRIYPRFDRTNKKLVGLRHYTGKQQCNCRVCKDHGRP